MREAGETPPPPGQEQAGTEPSPDGSRAYVEGVHLQRTDENAREIEALAAVLGRPAGLDGLLGDLKYRLRRARVLPRLLGRAVREAWAWDAYDERDENWYPQGISTSADASASELVGQVDGRATAAGCW